MSADKPFASDIAPGLKKSVPPSTGQDPHQVTCHQMWCNLLIAELSQILRIPGGKASRQFNIHRAAEQHNKAINKAIDFENYRFRIHLEALQNLMLTSQATREAIKKELSDLSWYRWGRKKMLRTEIREMDVQEDALKAAFMAMVNTPIPEPKAEPVAPPLVIPETTTNKMEGRVS